MNNNLKFDFNVDKDSKTVTVVREFAAPVARVWEAWTRPEMLDQWWAPKPWVADTKELDFQPGGRWRYAMRSPEGEEHWSMAVYESITAGSRLSWKDAFTDADGIIANEMPRSHWDISFAEADRHTIVTVVIRHERSEDMEKILAMGFQGGFSMGLGNLDELLAGTRNKERIL